MKSAYSKPAGSKRIWLCFVLTTVFACELGWTQSPATAIAVTGLPTSATLGATYTVKIMAVGAKGTVDSTYTNSATLTTTPVTAPPATITPTSVKFAAGVATAVVQFMGAGPQTLKIDTAAPILSVSTQTTVSTVTAGALAGCASCYASLGAGTLLVGKYPDYNVSTNILQATHVGISTPSYAVGVAYKLPFREPWVYKKISCTTDDFSTKRSDGQVAFCYPYKAFVSLKFTPDASQTFNGFTFGLSHALHQYLDLMVGLAYSAHNEISPGFQQAAVSVVKAQQSAGNPYYSQFNLASLEANNTQTAFDGFPTQLLDANGTTGPLIYSGNITISHYRPGLFLGISLPLSFKSAAAGQ
jgi:hypothetical protein